MRLPFRATYHLMGLTVGSFSIGANSLFPYSMDKPDLGLETTPLLAKCSEVQTGSESERDK